MRAPIDSCPIQVRHSPLEESAMAKKKDKKGARIPKKIGGVKIPKQLRKQGE